MVASVLTFGANTVRPLVSLLLYRDGATAGICLLVSVGGLYPFCIFLVVCLVKLAVGLSALCANSLCLAGCSAADMSASISTIRAYAVSPLVSLLGYLNRTTAIIGLLVVCRGL